MSAAKPATVTAEVTVGCAVIDGTPERHRVWINRDGSVLTPDHHSSEEDALEALGGQLTHPCAHWHAAVICKKQGTSLPVPELSSWQMGEALWSPNAMWTALTAILGEATFTPLSPDLALAHTQVYQAHGGLPESAVPHLGYLQSPWLRTTGFRRSRPTTPVELEALIETGIPVTRVASAAALGLTAEVAGPVVSRLAGYGVPADVVLNLAYALPPSRLLGFMDKLEAAGAERVEDLTVNLSRLKEHAASLSEGQVEAFLLGLDPAVVSA